MNMSATEVFRKLTKSECSSG